MKSCPGPVSRREFLKIGTLALGGLGAHGVVPWKLSAAPAGDPTAENAVIFVWLPGGPPHMEMYDLKPDAPAEYRGDFRPIHTNVPGIDISEHLPMHARVADKYTIIRSIAHTFSDHGGGHKRFLTGRDPQSPVGFVNDYPMVGSMVYRVRGQRPNGVPSYIAGTDGGRDGIDVFSFGSAYLGPSVHPFTVPGDPAENRFQVRNLTRVLGEEQLDDRLGLLARLDSIPDDRSVGGEMEAITT